MRVARPALLVAVFLGFSGLLPLVAPDARAAEPVVANKKSKVFHTPACRVAAKLKADNRTEFTSVADAEAAGFKGCKVCKPAGAKIAATVKPAIIGSGDTFHAASCAEVKKIKKKNRTPFASAAEASAAGLKPCGKCKP